MELVGFEFGGGDGGFVVDFNDAAGADGGVNRHRFHCFAVGNEMARGIHMRAGVGAHIEVGEVAGAVVAKGFGKA